MTIRNAVVGDEGQRVAAPLQIGAHVLELILMWWILGRFGIEHFTKKRDIGSLHDGIDFSVALCIQVSNRAEDVEINSWAMYTCLLPSRDQ